MPGILTWRGLRLPLLATRSTCAITIPPELCAAMAIASASSVSASFSMARLPSGSPAVARINEGAHADARDVTGAICSDVAKQMGYDAFGQIIGLDLI